MPISYPELYELIRKSTARIPGNELFEKVYPDSPETEWNTFQKYISNFNKWAEKEHGVIYQSTVGYRLYPADLVRDYRRKKK